MHKVKRFLTDPALFFILPGLAGFILFFIWPFFISLGYALVDKAVGGVFVGLKNYIDLLHNPSYLKALKNTLIFIGVSVPLNMVLSLIVSLLIRNTGKYKPLFVFVFLAPMVIPSGSMVFFWKSLFSYQGYLNYLLGLVGIDKISWLETAWARLVIIIIFIWKNLGYNALLFLSGLYNIPREYYEAARADGAGPLQAFRHVTMVFLAPTIVMVLIMSVINSFKVFKEIYLVAGSYPQDSIYMLQHFMNNMFSSLNYQKLATATSILVFFITILAQLLLKAERKTSS